MKALGKMRIRLSSEDYSKCLHSMYLARNELSFMELIDVIWGITRMGHPTELASNILQEEEEIFRVTESCILLLT